MRGLDSYYDAEGNVVDQIVPSETTILRLNPMESRTTAKAERSLGNQSDFPDFFYISTAMPLISTPASAGMRR